MAAAIVGQPGAAAQARVVPVQRVRPHHQELHQNLHRRQARVAHQVHLTSGLSRNKIEYSS